MGPGGFFPTNPDLAAILGRTDLNFQIFYFLFVGPQISRNPGSDFSEIWPGPRLGLGLVGALLIVSCGRKRFETIRNGF